MSLLLIIVCSTGVALAGPAPEPSRAFAASATEWPDIYATTDRGGRVSTGGVTTHRTPYVALPDGKLLHRTVYVRCECRRHGVSSPLIPFRVLDTGPWSVSDGFAVERRRPAAESGVSDTYAMVPRQAPAIDLTQAAWARLGHPGVDMDNYSGRVALVIIDSEIHKPAVPKVRVPFAKSFRDALRSRLRRRRGGG